MQTIDAIVDGTTSPYENIGDQVSIFRRGRIWQANFQVSGKQRRKSLRTRSKKEALRRAILIDAALQKGEYQASRSSANLEKACEQFLAHLGSERRAPKTIGKCELTLRRLRELASARDICSLSQIDFSFIDAYRAQRVAAGAKPKTILNESVIVRQLVNFGLSRKLIHDDPLLGLKLAKPKPSRQPCWTRGQVDLILSSSKGPHVAPLTLLAETGARVGEIKYLTWDDIDLAHGLIHIRAKDNWRPKTGDERAIPMSPVARAVLTKLPRKSRWVVTAAPSAKFPQGGNQISERRLLQYLKRVLKRLSLLGHLHTFRHAFISHALTKGTPEAIVRQWVGHVDRDVMKRYTHVADEISRDAMKRLASTGFEQARSAGQEKEPKKSKNRGGVSAQFQHSRRRR